MPASTYPLAVGCERPTTPALPDTVNVLSSSAGSTQVSPPAWTGRATTRMLLVGVPPLRSLVSRRFSGGWRIFTDVGVPGSTATAPGKVPKYPELRLLYVGLLYRQVPV